PSPTFRPTWGTASFASTSPTCWRSWRRSAGTRTPTSSQRNISTRGTESVDSVALAARFFSKAGAFSPFFSCGRMDPREERRTFHATNSVDKELHHHHPGHRHQRHRRGGHELCPRLCSLRHHRQHPGHGPVHRRLGP